MVSLLLKKTMSREKNWQNRKRDLQNPEEKNLGVWRGNSFDKTLAFFLGKEIPEEEYSNTIEAKSIFNGFLMKLRENGIRVSTPEWLHFLAVVKDKLSSMDLNQLLIKQELFETIRIYAKVTLIKNREDEFLFNEIFNKYFLSIAKVIKSKEQKIVDDSSSDADPKLKEQLGIKDVVENLEVLKDRNDDLKEKVHGGYEDQHNDVLTRLDKSKIGGGNLKYTKTGNAGGVVTGVSNVPLTFDRANEQSKQMKNYDRGSKYDRRPEKNDIRIIISNLRRIIADVSYLNTGKVDIKSTVDNLARKKLKIEYKVEREKQPEIVLFIDVGGPVDEWSSIIKEISDEMTKGLTKLEIYLFHNNLYGYVWKPYDQDLRRSRFAKPNSIIDIKTIIKRKKKLIIYGDAEMSYAEFDEDRWKPKNNNKLIESLAMTGTDCLNWIRRKVSNVVWVNPVLKKEWDKRDRSNTIKNIRDIIPMHDLSVGGVQDAIGSLMKK